MKFSWSLLLLLVAVPACEEAPARSGTTPTTPGSAAKTTAEADARKLVDAWIAAQNGGDFAAYQSLYAQSFVGVRRSGERTVELDRADWLKDRARMFKKPMTIEAAHVQIQATATGAEVELEQTWASGTYKDTGHKAMVFVQENGALRIAREEMLASQRLPAHPPVVATAGVSIPVSTAPYPDRYPLPARMSTSFHGQPAWLVLGEHFEEDGPAVIKAGELADRGIETTPVSSDFFENLSHGWIPLVHGAFATREEANARVAELKAKGLKTYAKYSGALSARPLVRVIGEVLPHGDLKPPFAITISFLDSRSRAMVNELHTKTYETSTDKLGWYQAWLSVPDGASEVEVRIDDEPPLPAGCYNWIEASSIASRSVHDKAGHDLRLRDVGLMPDCCGE